MHIFPAAFPSPFFPRARRLAAALAFLLPALAAGTLWADPAQAGEKPAVLRIGTLQFGTVNWELDVIRHHKLDEKEGVKIDIIPLASKNATAVALQGGAADVIVTDWIWVSRQRAEGRSYAFAPHSNIAGGLLARADSGITKLEDLEGKKLGIAGGAVDKSWLLLRAYARQKLGKDLATMIEPVYGAPPLLNELIEKNEFPAVLTFWNYEAMLKAKGYQQVMAIPDVLHALGISPGVPIVGWVFADDWAAKNTAALKAFLRASQAAKKILGQSDAEWERLKPQIKPADDATLIALREAYRAGIPTGFGAAEIASAEKLFALMAELGGEELTGKEKTLAPGTFWKGALDGSSAPAR